MISDKIKKLRISANLSQSELAKKLNLTRASINAWEMGISTPSTHYIVELARLFCVTTDAVLDLDDKNYINAEGLSIAQVKIIKSLISHFHEENLSKSE